MPGGRQRDGELLPDTLRREYAEETALSVTVGGLRYVAESYDPRAAAHFLSVVFTVSTAGSPATADDAHVVDYAWMTRQQLAEHITVGVVREPLLGHLTDARQRYFGYADAGITIKFADPV